MKYTATIRESSFELSARDRLKFKDTSSAIQIEEATRDGELIIPEVKGYVIVDIENEKARENPNYSKYVVVDTADVAYVTGSESFYKAFADIFNEMNGEPFGITIRQTDSKNYSGKKFITCSIL